MKAVVIDYYDSFVYNIVHYLEGLDVEVSVVQDRDVVVSDLNGFDFIVLSPGPGLPQDSFSMFSILKFYADSKPILGICLGMQGIASYFGGELYNLETVSHGVAIKMHIVRESEIFKNVPQVSKVGIYNSWACTVEKSIELDILSESDTKMLLAIKHKYLSIYGLQFHPESILTENGKLMMRNFVENVVF